jgi:sec-independent protein translocase protein TatC
MSTEPDKVMSFTDHLQELRTRLKYALISVVVTMIIAYAFSDVLFVWLAQPLIAAWHAADLGTPKLHFANPIEPFFTYIKISLLGGIFLSAPVLFYQLWAFIAPGLYRREKKYAIPFAMVSALFFVGGACFGYFVVFPLGFQFFLGFAQLDMGSMHDVLGGALSVSMKETFQIQPTLMMSEYLALVWRLLLGFGLIFELPLLIFFLTMAGVVTVGALWRFNRYFIIVAFVISAALTPPDVVTQVFMAGPLVILYNLSILVAFIVQRKKKEPDEAAPAPEE